MRWLRRSLVARIAASFFALSFFIVLVLTVTGSLFLVARSERRQQDQLDALADVKVEALNRWLSEQSLKFEGFARIGDVRNAAAALCGESGADPVAAHASLDTFLREMKPYYREMQGASILSLRDGRVVFSTERETEGLLRALDASFMEGRKGTFAQSVHLSTSTFQPIMTIATPIRGDSAGIAVLVLDLSIDSMDRVVRDRSGLGRTGRAYLVGRYNALVSPGRLGDSAHPRGVHSAGIESAIAGRNGRGTYVDYDGARVIGAYRWVESLKLALLVEIHADEVFADAWAQSTVLMILGIGLALVLAGGVYGLAHSLTRPILAVQAAAVRVAAGELDAKAPVLTADEIGVLAGSFNHMTDTVRSLYEEQKRREEYYRSLIESAMDVIFVTDGAGRFLFVSPSIERITGFAPSELAGTGIISMVHPEERERVTEEMMVVRGNDASAIYTTRFRASLKNGGWCDVEARARNLLGHPAIGGIIVSARDITERKRLETRLLQSQKLEAVGRLAGGVAHDFNNLLTVVIGYCELLTMQGELGDASRGIVREIKAAADRAAWLTGQLLAYSRRQLLQPRPVNLAQLIAGMKDMLSRLIGEDVAFVTKAEDGLRTVIADPHQVEQVVMNLATNARDAMPRGGTIVVEARNMSLDEEYCRRHPEVSPGDFVMLAVSDTGDGMDQETQSHIFEPFFTTKEVGRGTGLGLATVYGIVQQSGGHVSVYSEPGKGSTFRVYLPATTVQEAARIEERKDRGMADGTGTILVVEDEEPLRRMISVILTRAGYGVRVEASPAEALVALEESVCPDLLVTDVILPGMSGPELARIVQKERPGLKVLYISGYTESAIGERGVLPDGINFLAKPFTTAELTAKVRDALYRDS